MMTNDYRACHVQRPGLPAGPLCPHLWLVCLLTSGKSFGPRFHFLLL